MNVVKAHGTIAALPDHGASLMPSNCDVEAVAGLDATPALVTALAVVSGGLDDARDGSDLLDAVAHGANLIQGGVVDPDDWSREAERVIEQVVNAMETAAAN